MARAAVAFLGTLDQRRARQAAFPFTQPERLNWHYVPRRREGLPLKDMTAEARAAAHALLQAGLSAAGYAKARDVMRLEGVLRQLETFGAFNRDPDNYAVTIFGTPGQGAWGWRFEGHHLSLNFTVVPGRAVAVTPAFLGANPADVPSGSLKGLRALQAEQDVGLALAASLDPPQRLQATIAAESLGDIVSGPGREQSLRRPRECRSGLLAGNRARSSSGSSRPTRGTCAAIWRRASSGSSTRPESSGSTSRGPVPSTPSDPTTTASTGRRC